MYVILPETDWKTKADHALAWPTLKKGKPERITGAFQKAFAMLGILLPVQ